MSCANVIGRSRLLAAKSAGATKNTRSVFGMDRGRISPRNVTSDGLCMGMSDRLSGKHFVERLPEVVFRDLAPRFAQRRVKVVDAAAIQHLPTFACDNSFRRDRGSSGLRKFVPGVFDCRNCAGIS